MKVAILGGGSCFALNLARHYVDAGWEVLSISRSPMRPAPFTFGLEYHPQFRYRVAHLRTEMALPMALLDDFKPQTVINFAALCEVGLSWEHACDYYETNLMALVRLTRKLAVRSYLRRFVQIGSSEVYGSVETPATEETALNPSSPYAVSKAAFDAHLRTICRHQDFPGVIVMPSNGYCQGQTLNRIIPKAIIAAITGRKVKLQGGGAARKSYLHGDDISRAIMLVERLGGQGETYNCGPEGSTAIRSLVAMIASKFGKDISDIAEIAPERLGQDSQYLLDSTKIKELGWKDEITLDAGISMMIDWVQRNPELLDMTQTYEHRP